jgi:ABC-type multidrug transport system fused ATPase/permease subunit
MKKYLVVLNFRTLIALIIALLTLVISYIFGFSYNIDLTLVSIAIIFPLVFNIRGSFNRRERALQFLSQFRSALLTLDYYFKNTRKLTEDDKKEMTNILLEISNGLTVHLGTRENDTKDIDDRVQKVFNFITDKDDLIPVRYKVRIFRYLNDLHESIENLHAIHIHRTIISLKAYCEYSIYIFPVIYVPTIIYHVGMDASKWFAFFTVLFTQFILISLFNIQDHLEYPFDKVGEDDIELESFKFDR